MISMPRAGIVLFYLKLSDATGLWNNVGQCCGLAEHRKDPDDLEAQAGYMQGAAGIGALLLHANGSRAIRFPDSPW